MNPTSENGRVADRLAIFDAGSQYGKVIMKNQFFLQILLNFSMQIYFL
jgi:hypothetical protein